MSLHQCADSECCYFGQKSPTSCGCHKSDVQVLTEQRDELLAAAKAALGSANDLRISSAHFPRPELESAIFNVTGEA